MVAPRVLLRCTLAGAALIATAGCPRTGPRSAAEPRSVRVAAPIAQDLERTIDLPGDVVAYYQATLLAEVAGYVKSVRFDKGDSVRAGDLIAEIDVPELRSERVMRRAHVEQAQAALERARVLVETARTQVEEQRANLAHADALARLQISLHERAKALRKEGDISEEDLEVAAGKREAAVAERSLAEARLSTSQAEVKRAETDVDVARANVSAAKAALEQIEATLSYASVRAPFDGVITARHLDPGVLVQRATRSEAAQRIVTVATRGRVRLDFELPESEVAFVRSGSTLDVTSAAHGDRRFAGRVTRVASALRPETRTMLCEAELPNEDDALLPGMYVTVRVLLERRPGALVVPPLALVEKGGETFAFVLDGAVARRRSVQKGWDFGSYVEVRAGIAGSDRVILGAGDLHEGEKVVPTQLPWTPEAASPAAPRTERPRARGETP